MRQARPDPVSTDLVCRRRIWPFGDEQFQAEAVLAVFRQATIGPGLLVGTALPLWST
ncbi:MAG: hypothetical protein KAX24_02315 [Anaerolineae bacterium]|nr:hypothetical protein [Anaerolineae bacterium]